MMNNRRYFAVTLKDNKSELTAFYSERERKNYCSKVENNAIPVTMAEYRKMKKEGRA